MGRLLPLFIPRKIVRRQADLSINWRTLERWGKFVIQRQYFDAKGDLLVGSADSTPIILSSSENDGDALVVDDSTESGLTWGVPMVIPPFSMDGEIVIAGPSPHWPFHYARTVTSLAVTLNEAGAVDLGIDVYKNNAVAQSAVYPDATTGLQLIDITNISYAVGDSIAIGTSNAPAGAVGLLVQPVLAT